MMVVPGSIPRMIRSEANFPVIKDVKRAHKDTENAELPDQGSYNGY